MNYANLTVNPSPIDVLDAFISVNITNSTIAESDVWSKVLFSEDVLKTTEGIWKDSYEKVSMQAAQVIAMKFAYEKTKDNNDNLFLETINFLTSINKAIITKNAKDARKLIIDLLSGIINDEKIYHYKNFASILYANCKGVNDTNFVTKVSNFISSNIICLSIYDVYYCAGRIQLNTYDDSQFANIVLRNTAYGSYILNDIVNNNPNALFEIAANNLFDKRVENKVNLQERKVEQQAINQNNMPTTQKRIDNIALKTKQNASYEKQSQVEKQPQQPVQRKTSFDSLQREDINKEFEEVFVEEEIEVNKEEPNISKKSSYIDEYEEDVEMDGEDSFDEYEESEEEFNSDVVEDDTYEYEEEYEEYEYEESNDSSQNNNYLDMSSNKKHTFTRRNG